MGYKMRATFCVSFYCRKSKMNKNGLSPLELSIVINQERILLNLPSRLNPKDFNKKRKPSYIEDLLNAYRVKINEVCTMLMNDGLPITVHTLREYLKTGGIKTKTVQSLFEEYLSILQKRVGKNLTSKVYSKYELVKEFVYANLSPTKELCTITNADIVKLYDILKGKYLPSTSAGYMTRIKTIITYAFDNGYMKINPLNGIKIDKGMPSVEYLTTEEINALKALDLDDYPRLQKVRDLALIQSATGLAYIDLMSFNKNDIIYVNNTPTYTSQRAKTQIQFTTVILLYGMDVLNKYDTIPLVSNQKYNNYLKQLQKLASIKTNITTHLLRKSYAHFLLNNGVRLETISRCMGHSSTTITAKVYCRQTTETIAEEISKILSIRYLYNNYFIRQQIE